jgi:hypothetical protein
MQHNIREFKMKITRKTSGPKTTPKASAPKIEPGHYELYDTYTDDQGITHVSIRTIPVISQKGLSESKIEAVGDDQGAQAASESSNRLVQELRSTFCRLFSIKNVGLMEYINPPKVFDETKDFIEISRKFRNKENLQ